jgi:23S rRNA (cytosine1962-C5)-methyltransferase
MLADRRNHHEFSKGSFLGRASLQANPSTTAYREINGAADGFPGWTVDRYDKWLFVQHDENTPSGPLPSLHDGYTTGVYYFRNRINRSEMGSRERIKPTLLEGSPAPDVVPILENGVTYHVNLGSDLSSGIFLDQRPQRAWLTQNCDSDTRVLNCFAHCGAFSIAAAVAGASTVSLDLDKKWLDRVEPQLRANGIEDISKERHDCIYGDCKFFLQYLIRIIQLVPPWRLCLTLFCCLYPL